MNIYFIKTVCRQEGKTCVWNSQIELAGYCPETDSSCPASGHPGHSISHKKIRALQSREFILSSPGAFPGQSQPAAANLAS
jgi:SOS-response transcriptional repressor LexA